MSSSLSNILGKVELRILFSLYHNIYPFLDVDRVGIFNKFEDIIPPFVIFSYFSSYILLVNCIPFVTGTMHICMVTFFGLYLQKYAPMKKNLITRTKDQSVWKYLQYILYCHHDHGLVDRYALSVSFPTSNILSQFLMLKYHNLVTICIL